MAKGNYQAYQQLQPIQADYSGPAKRAEELFLAGEAQKKAMRAEAAKLEAERQKALADQLGTDLDKLDPKALGLARLDEAVFNVVGEAADRLKEEYDRAESDPSYAGSSEFALRRNKLTRVVKELAGAQEGISQRMQTYQERKKNGKLSNYFNNYVDTLDVDNMALKLDKNYDLLALSLNPDYNPESEDPSVPKVVSSTVFEVLRNGEDEEFFDRIDYEAELAAMKNTLGDRESQVVTGYGETTLTQSWEDVKVGAINRVKAKLGTKDNPTTFAKSLWADVMGLPGQRKFTEEQMKYMQESVLSDLQLSYDTKDVRKVDFSAIANRGNKTREEGGDAPLYSQIRIVKDPDTGSIQTGYQGEGPEGEDSGSYFSLPLKAKILIGGEEVPVGSVFLSDSGKLRAVVERELYKMSGSTVDIPLEDGDSVTVSKKLFEKSLLDTVNLSSLANALGLDNARTMKKFLQDYKESEKSGEGFPQEWAQTQEPGGVDWGSM